MSGAGHRLYLVGHPVAHSKSPVLQAAAFRALGLDWSYELADCQTQSEARAFFERRDWLAVNVTMPWKSLALHVARAGQNARVGAGANVAGGANLLVNCNGALFAENVDGAGCVAYLERCGVQIAGLEIAVCGTGPTALAIAHACVQAGASQVALLSRDEGRVQKAAAALEAHCRTQVQAHAYESRASHAALKQAHVIVDATSLGMNEGDPAPFDTSALSAHQTVLDVVYGHGETRLLADARAAGCVAFDGLGMLVGQAVETVRIVYKLACQSDVPEAIDLFQIMGDAVGLAHQGA